MSSAPVASVICFWDWLCGGRWGSTRSSIVFFPRVARIASAAKGGEILLSEATKAVAGRIRVPLLDRGPHELRGLSETTRLYEAVWRPG